MSDDDDASHEAAKTALRAGRFDEALKRYSELAASGSPEAWINLGWMYQHGKGVAKDLPEAERYNQKAFLEYSKLALSGSSNAWNGLGWMYEHGAVPTDLVEAQRCYREAVALGHLDAHDSLARLLIYKNDYQSAIPFIVAAADKGHVGSTYWLGRLYLKGTGVEKDVRKAQIYLKQAADMGHLYARRDYHLGLLRGTFGQRELLSGLIGWLRALLALRSLRWLWARSLWYSKIIGLAFLAAYFLHYPFHFEGVWVAAAIAIPLGVSVVFAAVVLPVVERFVPSQRSDETSGLKIMGLFWKRPLRELLLLPGEDGLFFVPLLLVGITPISAALFSVAYGVAHYPVFSLRYCVGKSVFLFLIAMIVLPHGLAPVIVAHVVSDTMAFLVGRKVFLNAPTVSAS